MAAAGLTHSQLATKLLVEGCLANIAGNVQGRMPMAPIQLTALERADAGLPQGGSTLFYPLDVSGVFIDLMGTKATVWFTDADYDRALDTFEAAMKGAFPRTKQLKDSADPRDADARLRTYEVDLGGSRLALVDVEYVKRGAASKRFIARVVAQARKK
jgi:hypothetical protein